MQWLFLIVGTLLVVEFFFFLPLDRVGRELFAVVNKSTSTILSSNISDHWKEKVIPAYAQKLFINSIYLFALVIIAISPIFFLDVIGSFFNIKFILFLATLKGILASTGWAVIYVILRRKIFPKTS